MRACVVVALLCCVGCTVPESANPTPRCEVESDCTATEHCYRGLCVPDALASDAGGRQDAGPREPMCDDGRTWCEDNCRDTREDERHCGSCNHECGEDEQCRHGHCEEKD